jgi:hypothetical protein
MDVHDPRLRGAGHLVHFAICILQFAFCNCPVFLFVRHRLAAIAPLLLLTTGCAEELITDYGERGTVVGQASVNGTSVLGDLFKAAGHQVGSWHRLSPGLWERADVIIWFPDDALEPSDEAMQWLEDWLYDAPGRTLIYVGRDFDAAPGYWKKVAPGATGAHVAEIARLQAEAQADYQVDRGALPSDADWGWFTMQGTLKPRQVRTLDGAAEWLEGVDPQKVEIELNSRIVPPEDYFGEPVEVLLESEGDALVTRAELGQSQLIVVANGSFLLNLPLVNHEHRRLAAALVRQVGKDKKVVFLESSSHPLVSDEDPEFRMPTGLELFGVKPFNQILLHFAVLGIIFCFVRLPLFGQPREEPRPALSDFGQHVASLGELLALTGDRRYAWDRLMHYQQTVRRDQAGVRTLAEMEKARQAETADSTPSLTTSTEQDHPTA